MSCLSKLLLLLSAIVVATGFSREFPALMQGQPMFERGHLGAYMDTATSLQSLAVRGSDQYQGCLYEDHDVRISQVQANYYQAGNQPRPISNGRLLLADLNAGLTPWLVKAQIDSIVEMSDDPAVNRFEFRFVDQQVDEIHELIGNRTSCDDVHISHLSWGHVLDIDLVLELDAENKWSDLPSADWSSWQEFSQFLLQLGARANQGESLIFQLRTSMVPADYQASLIQAQCSMTDLQPCFGVLSQYVSHYYQNRSSAPLVPVSYRLEKPSSYAVVDATGDTYNSQLAVALTGLQLQLNAVVAQWADHPWAGHTMFVGLDDDYTQALELFERCEFVFYYQRQAQMQECVELIHSVTAAVGSQP